MRIHLLALLSMLVACTAAAETQVWADITRVDLEAARSLIERNHPAAVPEHNDAQFVEALRTGYAQAQQLLLQVRSYQAYRAVLARFAASFGDRHVSSEPLLESAARWPGFLVSMGNGWRVSVSVEAGVPPLHARLLQCDGQSPDELAVQRLQPVTSNWSIAAQRKRMSHRLLVDEGDPFVPLPQRCLFELPSGGRIEHTLVWRSVSRQKLKEHLQTAEDRPAKHVAITAFSRGWWIRLGTLGESALPIVHEVERRAREIRDATVVVDLRGNGGGSSIYAERIAAVLYGPNAVQQALAANEPDGSVWRVSTDNLATVRGYIERFTRELGENDVLVQELKRTQVAIEHALRQGERFAIAPPTPHTAEKEVSAEHRPQSDPHVLLLTDRFCFSSCLLATHLFLQLGALHVGEETDQNTHYTEVRDAVLPSGLSSFSTMQAYAASLPKRVGPYTPRVPFGGPMSDDQAVQRWVETLLQHYRHRAAKKTGSLNEQ